MLRILSPNPEMPTVTAFLPPIARPLLDAVTNRAPLTPVLHSIAEGLGFDHFVYVAASSPRPTRETRACTWTSLPEEWIHIYDDRAFIEIDPRLRGSWNSPLPYLWDRASCTASPDSNAFFDAAAAFGVASGIAIALRNRFDVPGIFMLDSSVPVNDAARLRHIRGVMGQAMVLAAFVHDLLQNSIVERCLPSPIEGRGLSSRERECLQLAARGLSSREIGAVLRIGERTVHTHFANLLAKLGAANRHEAIAKASATGLIAA